MGCGSSKKPDQAAGGGGGGANNSAPKADVGGKPKQDAPKQENKSAKLLDKYTLGEVLGQGAFGVVYACEKKGTKEQFAVKMVDMAESPLVEIKKECDMLTQLAHPCVVKLHDVYYEKVFVCMVMDIIKGGDMINGMQAHWQSKGTIAADVTQNVSKQMITAIAWLHSKNTVHRDLKGDNFLMDRKDISNAGCRIYLSDFGTVVPCAPGQRLSAKCGTKLYWSPEFYLLNYGLKVDIWAIGVVMYGLVSGRFPFKDEKDVNSKQIKLSSKFPKEGQEVILSMLERDENKRYSAQQCLEKPFMANVKSAAYEEMEKMEAGFKPEMKESGGNQGVNQRRAELVQRLQEAKGGAGGKLISSVAEVNKPGGFEVVNPVTNAAHTFEWWPKSKVDSENLMDKGAKPAPAEDVVDDGAVEGIQKQLEEHQIKTADFGKGQAKTMKDFVSEMVSGASRLMLDAASYKNLVRVVDVVLLRVVVTGAGGKKLCIQSSEQYPDGRTRDGKQLPGAKKEPHENGIMTANRIVQERLGMKDCDIKWDFNAKECFEEEEDSPSYPGVKTVYRKEIFEGVIGTKDAGILSRIGASGSGTFKQADPKNYTRTFVWSTEAECDKDKVLYKAPKEGAEVSALVAPPTGFEEEELEAFLKKAQVDPQQFGTGNNRTLKEFSAELVSGEAVLQRGKGGKATRVVDVVVVYITKKDGSVLVEKSMKGADGKENPLNRLPAVKRRSDENQFLAAHRVLNRCLRISEHLVTISDTGVKYLEEEKESKGYCGISTRYQKRFVMGTLNE